MALRCKGGTEGEVLNFPRSTYADLLPLLGQLSRVGVHGVEMGGSAGACPAGPA
jgi:hypothetical protein